MPQPILPPPDETLRTAYQHLILELDRQMDKLIRDHLADKLQCKPGCTACCMDFSVLPLEAALVQEKARQVELNNPDKEGFCRFLVDARCTLYAERPVICRTQGLPLAYRDEESGVWEVSACFLNFSESYQFDEEDLFFMDRFNLRLAEMNRQYCHAAHLDPGQRIALAALTETNSEKQTEKKVR